MQLNPNISGDFRPSEQIFPGTSRWVPLNKIYQISAIRPLASTPFLVWRHNVTMPRPPFARFLTWTQVKFHVFKRQKRGEGKSKSKNNFWCSYQDGNLDSFRQIKKCVLYTLNRNAIYETAEETANIRPRKCTICLSLLFFFQGRFWGALLLG